MKKTLKAAFPLTIPVLAGYLFLGMAFGILLKEAGYGVLWALVMSIVIYAGSGQYLCVSLLAAGASIPQVILLTVVLHFRHFFYGLSLIEKYRDCGWKKYYMIFGLTDETYALLSSNDVPEGVRKDWFYFAVTAMDHSYWIIGSVIGNALGSIISINMTGVDFVMTSLFAVLVVEQWFSHRDHRPAIIGFAITLVALIALGPDNFLIPALIVISGALLAARSILTKEEAEQ